MNSIKSQLEKLHIHENCQRLKKIIILNRKRLGLAGLFCGAYLTTVCLVKRHASHEVLRMSIAGSLTNTACEMMFHAIDTVNIRTKVYHEKISTFNMFLDIIRKEGIYGLYKGLSASFYGSVFCGFIYFGMYKYFKSLFREVFQDENELLVFFMASFVSEIFTLIVYYPFDLIKARLQTRNSFFQYKSLLHAFRTIVANDSFFALYTGSLAFFTSLTVFISIQFTTYEAVIAAFKRRRIREKGEVKLEPKYSEILIASSLSGALSSAMTNGFEVITVRKQTSPELRVSDILRQEKFGLITKGIAARVYHNTISSVVFFMLLSYVGKQFNVVLTD